ncbi:hypothetical protein EOM60_05555 [Candidatus Saccharibacteria bacterium]|nr:hypothetical protein [Candidatus Saccharibacteria bacterium]
MLELLTELSKYCQDALSELSLQSKDRGELPSFKSFIGEIPGENEKPRASDFPLLLFRLVSFEDPLNALQSTLYVRIFVGVYCIEESNGDTVSPGYHNLLNTLKRLRQALLKKRTIGKRWRLREKVSGGPFEIQSYPYYFGDLLVQFEERQNTEEFTVEEEIDNYGSAYGNDQSKDWRYPVDSPNGKNNEGYGV